MDDDARRVIALNQAVASVPKDAPPEDVTGRAEAYARFLARSTRPLDAEDREILAQLIAEMYRFIETRCAPQRAGTTARIWAADRNRLFDRAAEAIGNLKGIKPVKIIHAPLPEEGPLPDAD